MRADKAKNIANVQKINMARGKKTDIEIKAINEIKLNPNNPRIIKDDKFHKLVESVSL